MRERLCSDFSVISLITGNGVKRQKMHVINNSTSAPGQECESGDCVSLSSSHSTLRNTKTTFRSDTFSLIWPF